MAKTAFQVTRRERAVKPVAVGQGEHAAQLGEEKYRLLFELNPCPMWICDENGLEMLDVNKAALKLYGWSRKEFLRMAAKDILPPGDAPRFLRVVRRQRRSRATFDGECRHRKRDGTVFDAAVTISFMNWAGRAARLVLVNDHAERKRMEQALLEGEQRLGGIVNSAMDAIISVNEQQRIIMFNAAAERMFERPAGKAIGQPLARLIPKCFHRTHARHIRKFGDAGVTSRQMGALGEISGLRPNGEEFPIEASISQAEVAGRTVFTVILRDISGRKRAEAELSNFNALLERRVAGRTGELTDAYERLHAIMDTALVGILTLDERGVVKSLNPTAVQIFGYQPQEIVGQNISRLMTLPGQNQTEDFLAHYQRIRGKDFTSAGREVLGRRKDGHGIILELAVTELRQGGQWQFVAMVRDITGRKRLERELLEVGERERQRIGHDLHDGLGQHLHALYYMAALLQRELKAESSPRAREAGRLSKLLARALDLSRSLAHGLQPVTPVPEGLMMTLRELARRTRALYRVDCQFDCGAPVFIHRHSAATHLYRIAQEAVNNAMKHGKSTRIRIQLTGTPQRIALVIRDNGVGIRRRTKHSQGMGLHIMQYRADVTGGSLLLRRHPRGGTELVCTVSRQALLPDANEVK